MLRAGPYVYVALALAVGAGVASAQSVHTYHDPSVNFSSYKTYYWAKPDPVQGNEILNEQIMWDIDAGMARRGWTKAASDKADLAVVANVARHPQQKLETITVKLFDTKTKKVVWRGVATETVSYSPVKNKERIDQSIETMFGDKFLEND